MQKKILIVSAIFVFLSTALYAFMLIQNAKVAEPAAEVPASGSGNLGGTTIPVTPLITPLVSPELQAKIDTLKSSWINLEEGFYTVKNEPRLAAPSIIPDYSIEYNDNTKVFSVLLYRDSLLANRQKAGEDIMNILQIEREEACKLDVQVIIPESVNVDYASKNLKLSFCPGFVDLAGVLANNGVSNINPDNPEVIPSDVEL